jgi:hypothetical protein
MTKMMSDDFYYNYLGKAALSSSIVKKLLKSPKSYYYTMKYGNPMTSALRMGRLLHQSILEPHLFEKYTFVECKSRTAKVFRDTIKQNEGNEHTIFTAKEKSETERLQDALLKNESALKLMGDSEFEVPAIDMIEGIPFRGKADIIGEDKMVDIKTTSSIDNFVNKRSQFSAYAFDYDIQVYIYCELFGRPYHQFSFLVIDKQTLDIGIFGVSEEFYLSGMQKTFQAIERYKQFFNNGNEIDLDSYTINGIL